MEQTTEQLCLSNSDASFGISILVAYTLLSTTQRLQCRLLFLNAVEMHRCGLAQYHVDLTTASCLEHMSMLRRLRTRTI